MIYVVILACIGMFFPFMQIVAGGEAMPQFSEKSRPTLSGIPADMHRFIYSLLIAEQEELVERDKQEFECEVHDTEEVKEIKKNKMNYKALACLATPLTPLLINKRLTALIIDFLAKRLKCSEFVVATYLASTTTDANSIRYLYLWLKNTIEHIKNTDIISDKINIIDTVLGTNPLFETLKQKNVAILKLLLSQGARINVRNSRKMTPLMVAAQNPVDQLFSHFFQFVHGPLSDAKMLCANKQEINPFLDKKDYQGRTALYHAVKKNNIHVTKRLLESGVEVNIKNNARMTPLHRAASEGNSAIISLLLCKGAGINAQDFDGKTPLMRAFIYWSTNSEGKRMWDKYSLAITELLAHSQIDLSKKDNEGKTAIDWAEMLNAMDIPVATLVPSLYSKT